MAETHSLSVVLQHQNRLVREMLAGHLIREPGITLAGTAPSGPELVQLCTLRRPAVAIFELDTPRWSNERLVTLLAQSGRNLRLIGIHDALPAAYVIRAYEAGVSALVSYGSGFELLLDTIRNPSLPVEAARARQYDGDTLTERELQVLYLISAGYSPKQVATELEISPHTVENHKQRIFSKLDVHNQAHAAASAVRLGLLPRAVPATHRHPKTAKRRRRVSVALRDPAGYLATRIHQLLEEERVPLYDASQRGADNDGWTDYDVLVTVLVDPTRYDWPAAVARQGEYVVVTSQEPSNADISDALNAGVTTVPASRVDDLLVPAIRAAGQGYVLVSSGYVGSVLGQPGSGTNGNWQRWELALTPRERDILQSIRRGQATKQTARQLGISVRTVENLQSNLFRKLRVHSRAAAIAAAHDLGLLDD